MVGVVAIGAVVGDDDTASLVVVVVVVVSVCCCGWLGDTVDNGVVVATACVAAFQICLWHHVSPHVLCPCHCGSCNTRLDYTLFDLSKG